MDARRDFICGSCDPERGFRIEHPQLGVGLGRSFFYPTVGMDQWQRQAVSGDREIQHCPLGGRTIEGGGGHLHFSHRVTFGAFGSHLCYVLAEKQQKAPQTNTFWLLIIGLLVTVSINQLAHF